MRFIVPRLIKHLRLWIASIGFLGVFGVLLASLILIWTQPSHATPEVFLPTGFSVDTVVEGLTLPTDMAFLPSGDILVTEKGGVDKEFGQANVRLVRGGQLLTQPVLTLYVSTLGDSGILGVVVDPDFETNGIFYLWYSTGPGSLNYTGTPVFRLSRFVLNPLTDKADPASEQIILDSVEKQLYHGGGGLVFDAVGDLFVTTGEMFRYQPAQNLTSLNGKVLRIHPTADGYTIPGDNPFVNSPNARPEIYALGLRNPFRATYVAATDQVILGDVGHGTWEEVNIVTPGANFGWPEREGPCPIGEIQPCAPAPPQFTDPYLAYQHDPPMSGSAIAGVTYFSGDGFPEPYRHKLFFSDYTREFIAWVDLDPAQARTGASPAAPAHEMNTFATYGGFMVDLEYYDNALYTLEIGTGRIRSIRYTGSDTAPAVVVAAMPETGAAPLTSTLSATVINPKPGQVYTYTWQFGDGFPVQISQQATVTHTFGADGLYQSQVTAMDTDGRVSAPATVSVLVYSDELPRIDLQISGGPQRTRFQAGDTVVVTAMRQSGLSGLDPVRPYTWDVLLHHNTHTHPYLSNETGQTLDFVIGRDNHDNATDIWYEFVLTLHTQTGLAVPVRREIFPQIVTTSLAVYPAMPSAPMQLNQVTVAAPHTFSAIVGTEQTLTAPPMLLGLGRIFHFYAWLGAPDSGPTLIARIPDYDSTFTALYLDAGPAHVIYLPLIQAVGRQ